MCLSTVWKWILISDSQLNYGNYDYTILAIKSHCQNVKSFQICQFSVIFYEPQNFIVYIFMAGLAEINMHLIGCAADFFGYFPGFRRLVLFSQ